MQITTSVRVDFAATTRANVSMMPTASRDSTASSFQVLLAIKLAKPSLHMDLSATEETNASVESASLTPRAVCFLVETLLDW